MVDTPGFNDDGGPEVQNQLIKDMTYILDHEVESANAIVLNIKGQSLNRIDYSMHSMLKDIASLFGENVWSRLIINIGYI